MGIKGEPSTPEDPSKGLVWSAIVAQVDQPGSQSEFVSVGDSPRELFHKHPWSIGGAGASELKEQLDEGVEATIGDEATSIGFASFAGLDEVYIMDRASLLRRRIPSHFIKAFIFGELVRDFSIEPSHFAFAPYGPDFGPIEYAAATDWGRYLWHFRTSLASIISFGGKTRS